MHIKKCVIFAKNYIVNINLNLCHQQTIRNFIFFFSFEKQLGH